MPPNLGPQLSKQLSNADSVAQPPKVLRGRLCGAFWQFRGNKLLVPRLPIGDCRLFGQMRGPLSHHWRKRAEDLRRQMQTAIGQQLRVKYELPRELPPELAMLLIRMDEKPEEQCTAHHKGPSSAA